MRLMKTPRENHNVSLPQRTLKLKDISFCRIVKDVLWEQSMGCLELVTDKCRAPLSPETEIIILRNTTHMLTQVGSFLRTYIKTPRCGT